MAVELTYAEVRQRVEAVLLRLVREGRAEFRGVGRRGPTYSMSEPESVWDHLEAAGLVAHNIPWPFTLKAVMVLRRGKP